MGLNFQVKLAAVPFSPKLTGDASITQKKILKMRLHKTEIEVPKDTFINPNTSILPIIMV